MKRKVYTEKIGKLLISCRPPYKEVEITIGEESTVVDKSVLFGVLFPIFSEEQQENLVTTTTQEVKAITRLLMVKAEKNIKKGEIISVPYTYMLPKDMADHLIDRTQSCREPSEEELKQFKLYEKK